jgi:diguanylate cyclase (GGDEF)-like protein/putative nucleotidyltransferase with HDIG domain
MNNFDLSEYNWRARIFWCLLLGAALAVLGISAFTASHFTFSQHFILAIALVISGLINQYQLKIPDTRIEISARELIVFWGTIWLGVPAAALIAASASLITIGKAGRDKKIWSFGVFTNIAAAFVSANVFYLVLGYVTTNFSDKAVAGNVFIADKVILSAGVMALTHLLFNWLVNAVFSAMTNEYSAPRFSRQDFPGKALGYMLSLAATILLYYAFIRFGIEFGLVLLPAAILGNLGYTIHTRRLAQKTREISDASRVHLATVEALATAIDARDQVGIGHVRRTQIYAIGVGEILGLSEENIDALRTGALLHDIGKLAVPDHILNKPGRLTPAEIEKTKIHSSVGASILEKVGFSTPVVPTVKYHHECWDGSGYPDGLEGEAIPLTARILSIADAYDTLRGARPYRPAVSRDEARRYLINGAGGQFDPKIVDVFLRNLRQFENEVVTQGLSYAYDQPAQDASNRAHTTDDAGGQSYVEQIKRANREVFTLYELARVFSSSLNLNETLSLFAKKVGDFVPYDTCAIYLFDEATQVAKAAYVKGKHSDVLSNKEVKAGEGATGFVLKKHQPVRNIKPGLDFSFSHLEFVQEYRSMASLPLIADEKFIGAVSLYSCELEIYEEEHLRILETVTRIAADAICKSIQHAETESHALTDPMTGLPNARSLHIQFDKEVARANRTDRGFQVLMLDLDGFKAVNDTFGHKAGDSLLRGVSRAMSAQLRDYDFLSRYAGDEFVAIIPDTGRAEIDELCGRLERAVADFKLEIEGGKIASVGVSLGAASYPQSGRTFDQVVVAADKAMYAEKSIRKQKARAIELENDHGEILEATEVQPVDESHMIHDVDENDMIADGAEDGFIVELDESHVISTAIN